MDEQDLKKFFKKTFDTVATGYDSSALRFFPDSAGHISKHLNLKGSEHLLDVATGTGCVALTIAKELPNGQVTGIDFSTCMLTQAIKKKNDLGFNNVDFLEMDMQDIAFPDNYFDAAVSAFSIFFVEDMKKQLSYIAQKVKNGGQVLTTTFYDSAFSPLVDLFLSRLENYGVKPPTLAWKRVATLDKCVSLFTDAGLQNVNCIPVECGYYLKDATEWWYIIMNGGFRGLVDQLSENELEKFKKEHLAETQELASDNGIWLEMTILFTAGSK